MRAFSTALSNVTAPELGINSPAELTKPIKIAIIDDGVDISQQPMRNRVRGGDSMYDDSSDFLESKPYWFSDTGHGTAMASFILQVFPLAELYVLRLDSHESWGSDGRKTLIFKPQSAIEVGDLALPSVRELLCLAERL